MRGLLCERLLYLHKTSKNAKKSVPILNKLIGRRNGIVKERAIRSLSSDFRFYKISNYDVIEAANETSKALENAPIVIQKPLFVYDTFYTSADAVKFENNELVLYNIQVRTALKKNQIIPLGYQYSIIQNAGYKIKDVIVITLNPDYKLNSSLLEPTIFTHESVKHLIDSELNHYNDGLEFIKSKFPAKSEPAGEMGKHCFRGGICNYFEHCFPEIKENNIFSLGGMHLNEKLELYFEGKTTIDDIPDDYELNDFSKAQLSTLGGKKTIVEFEEIRKFLNTLEKPIYFTDFEAIQPAIPIFEGCSPYQQIPFQFYLILLGQDGEEHYNFLPEKDEDPRENFVKNFLEKTGEVGSILVYDKTSEIKMLRELIKEFPDKREKIENRIYRFVDLKEPFEKMYFYHHEMKGSKTLKNVIAVIDPKSSYSELEIANGGSASFLFELYHYNYSEIPIEELKANLTEYCKMDVVSMVKIVEFLKKLVGFRE